MPSDFEIGRVVAVDTAHVTVQLNSDLKGLARTTYEGPQEIGRINSYVIMPVGGHRLVAMVNRVVLTEDAEVSPSRTMVTLPSAKRIIKATLIGTIDGNNFAQGVSLFPVLDNPVHLVSESDLEAIFGRETQGNDHPINAEEPGFCVTIGNSAVFERLPIKVDPDATFGKHLAVLGSTGSGKSCTIASIIQAILAHETVSQTRFVILDTNGEYRSAFQSQRTDQQWQELQDWKSLYVPSDATATARRLVIPYWFMNADDFVRLFRASQGVQRPVLLEALRKSRNEATDRGAAALLREELSHELNRLWTLSGKDEKTSKDVRDLANGLKNRLDQQDLVSSWADVTAQDAQLTKDSVQQAVEAIRDEAAKHIDNNTYPKVLPADARKAIRDKIDPLLTRLTGSPLGQQAAASGVSADNPTFFDKRRFRTRHIEQVLRGEESGGARARDYSGTMLLRIDRLFDDKRFEFLLGPTDGQLPHATHVLATFIRDVLGMRHRDAPQPPLSSAAGVPDESLPFYGRQRAGSLAHDIVILDLSLLASEVLENVTALIGRLILEFLQRLGEHGGEAARGSLPVVLVLEEAQNYAREQRFGEDESISRVVFERIAREGRKYGLGLVVASQRPSELSKTVLSQCNSFIVHRLQNPEDLRYFKEIVPGIFGPLLDQLPALAPQIALILGACVRAPALVRIRDCQPVPRSRDPKFYRHWVETDPPVVPVEEVCAKWEGRQG
jgi:hypothetical protein